MMRPGLAFLLARAIAPVVVVGVVGACGDDGTSLAAGAGGSGAPSSSATSTGPSTSTSSGTGAGGATSDDCSWADGAFPSDVCGACATSACCDAVLACDADPLCGPLVRCFAACDHDRPCMETCFAAHPEQTPAQLAIGECVFSACAEACPPTCEDLLAPPDARDPGACTSCMHTECCDEAAQQTPDFFAWAQCSQQCADALCLRGCELAHPGATDIASAMNRCVFDEPCGESCTRSPTENDVCGGFQIGNETCAECAREACCAADEACAFDVSCLNAFACVLDCYDVPSCRTCYEAWPAETMGRVLVVDGCVSAGCTEACGSDGCGNTKHLTSLACDTCTRGACCAEQGACTDDAACAGLLVCTTVCDGDAACVADCEGLFPTAVTEHDALRTCQAASCAEECGP